MLRIRQSPFVSFIDFFLNKKGTAFSSTLKTRFRAFFFLRNVSFFFRWFSIFFSSIIISVGRFVWWKFARSSARQNWKVSIVLMFNLQTLLLKIILDWNNGKPQSQYVVCVYVYLLYCSKRAFHVDNLFWWSYNFYGLQMWEDRFCMFRYENLSIC